MNNEADDTVYFSINKSALSIIKKLLLIEIAVVSNEQINFAPDLEQQRYLNTLLCIYVACLVEDGA